jgi:hypothetical protein
MLTHSPLENSSQTNPALLIFFFHFLEQFEMAPGIFLFSSFFMNFFPAASS